MCRLYFREWSTDRCYGDTERGMRSAAWHCRHICSYQGTVTHIFPLRLIQTVAVPFAPFTTTLSPAAPVGMTVPMGNSPRELKGIKIFEPPGNEMEVPDGIDST